MKTIDMVIDLLEDIIWQLNYDSSDNVDYMLKKLKEIKDNE